MTVLERIPHLDISPEQIEALCRKWGIIELSVFGSVLRDSFTLESDVDVLVVMHPDVSVTFSTWDEMELELADLVGRPVDFVFKRSIERSRNWIRRREILGSAQVIYAAQ